MKTYRVAASRVWINTVAGNLLLAAMLVWAIYSKIQGRDDWQVWTLLVALPIILISATLGNHQPTEIVVTPESITFAGLGRRYTYEWKTLNYLMVKRYMLGDRYLVQLGEFRLFSGRYWIPTHMEGHKELIAFLQAKEKQIRTR